MTFLSSFINILSGSVSWIESVGLSLCLWFDGIIYSLVSYAFELFMIMCQLNYNSIYFAISPLLDRVEALIVVVILFKVAMVLIQCLINPDNLKKSGPDLIKNIAIAAVIIVSYNFVFGVINEVSMLIVGTPEGYEFTYLSSLADITSEQDEGLIMRFLFGSDSSSNGNVGDYLSYKTITMFLYDNDGGNRSVLNAISTGDGSYDFTKLSSLPVRSGKIEYKYPVVSGIMGLYLIYSLVCMAIQVGVRMFKLIVLQMLTPVAAISIIGEGTKAKVWSNYLSTVVSTFTELFIRMFSTLLTVCLILLFFENVEEFFVNSNMGTGITKFLVITILIVACFKFAKIVPELIDKVIGSKMAGQKSKFASTVGSILGAGVGTAVGAVSGLTAGINAGAGLGTVGTTLTGAVSGLTSGFKGNTVAEKFKNIGGISATNRQRAADLVARGGYSGSIAGGWQNFWGVGARQDRDLARLENQSSALEAYNEAATAAIKDNALDDFVGAGDSSYSASSLTSSYNDGWQNVKFGDNRDGFVEDMLKYDRSYIEAQSRLDVAMASGRDSDIAAARTALQAVRTKSEDNAKELYKQATNYYVGKDDIAINARSKYNKSAHHADDATIDYKSEKTRISNEKRAITSDNSYARTHNQKK